jgi:hypothetical protein
MKKIRIISFFVCLISIYSCVSNTDNNTSLNEESIELIPYHSDTIPFTMADVARPNFNRILINGRVFDKNIIFLLDNGMLLSSFSRTIIPQLEMNKFQKFNATWTEDIHYIPNEKIDIQLNDYFLRLDSIRLDINPLLGIDGTIGFELFENNIVEIDFIEKNIVLHNQLPKIENYIELPLSGVDSFTYPIEKRHRIVEINGFFDNNKNMFSERLLLDLGNPLMIFSPETYKKIDFENSKRDSLSLTYYIFNGIIPNSVLTDNDGKPFFETNACWNIGGILGIGFFKQFHVFFDYPHDKLYLKPINNE